MNQVAHRTHPRNWLARGLVAVVLGFLVAGSALAAEPLQAKAQKISGDFSKRPEKLMPPTDFTVAKEPPVVEFVQIPLPDTKADPWSIWGYGLLHSNGKFYVPLGDHLGVDANAYIYEYDPETKTVRQMADIQSAVKDFKPGDFGFGKVHGRLNEGRDGGIYFATYWGQWQTESDKFEGDRVFRYDPKSEKLTDLGMPVYGWGYPSTHMDPQRMLLYAEAHKRKGNSKGDPNNKYVASGYKSYKDPYEVKFLVYDVEKQKVIFHGAHETFNYGRDFFVDADGNAYWNAADTTLEKYDPKTNSVSKLSVKMPGASIRRTVGPDANGVMYGVTHDTKKLFSFDPKTEKIRTITTVWADSPGMDVTPDGKYVYCVPGGHGPSSGTPLIQVNVADGSQKVIAFLHAPIWEQAKFHLGGTYCVQVSEDGANAYVGFNGKPGAQDKAWGGLAVVAVQIPASER